MSNKPRTRARWEKMRTAETRMVEAILRKVFPHTDAYRYNSASIRVRVVDPQFEGKSVEERDALVDPVLARLPKKTQAEVMNLITLYPGETTKSLRALMVNSEFEEPSPSML